MLCVHPPGISERFGNVTVKRCPLRSSKPRFADSPATAAVLNQLAVAVPEPLRGHRLSHLMIHWSRIRILDLVSPRVATADLVIDIFGRGIPPPKQAQGNQSAGKIAKAPPPFAAYPQLNAVVRCPT